MQEIMTELCEGLDLIRDASLRLAAEIPADRQDLIKRAAIIAERIREQQEFAKLCCSPHCLTFDLVIEERRPS